MRRILEDPETLIPEGAEGLARHLEGLTGHSYSRQMQAATYNIKLIGQIFLYILDLIMNRMLAEDSINTVNALL